MTNILLDDGCTLADQIGHCAEDAMNHGDFVSCVAHLTNDWKKAGYIHISDRGSIVAAAAGSNIGN